MTPKEKAKELVDSFYTIDSDSEMFDGFTMPIFYAERCALIAVDEILNNDGFTKFDIYLTEYWQEVKTKIEAL